MLPEVVELPSTSMAKSRRVEKNKRRFGLGRWGSSCPSLVTSAGRARCARWGAPDGARARGDSTEKRRRGDFITESVAQVKDKNYQPVRLRSKLCSVRRPMQDDLKLNAPRLRRALSGRGHGSERRLARARRRSWRKTSWSSPPRRGTAPRLTRRPWSSAEVCPYRFVARLPGPQPRSPDRNMTFVDRVSTMPA